MACDDDGIQFLLDRFEDVEKGYLVDIGAHDGVEKGSMTRDLVLKGWGGLMVEPLPEAYAKLSAAYAEHPCVQTIHCACSDSEGTATLYPCKGVSTLDPEWAAACDAWWKHVTYGKPITVEKYTLSTLLARVDAPHHICLLQIDTEGHDLHVLRGMDWSRRVDVICVETLDMRQPDRRTHGIWQPHPDMHAFLESQGYSLALLTIGGNGIYIRRDLH